MYTNYKVFDSCDLPMTIFELFSEYIQKGDDDVPNGSYVKRNMPMEGLNEVSLCDMWFMDNGAEHGETILVFYSW